MKKFIAEPEFWELFPDASIAILSLDEVDENVQLGEQELREIQEILDRANETAKQYVPNDPISQNPVVQTWREAYRRFPTKKGARCSVEALLKRVLQGKKVGSIVPSVDITNAISLKYAFPIGVEDKDKFEGDIRLGVMKGGESFIPIGEKKEDPPKEGELAYYDEGGVICRCWNWRDGIRTAVGDDTTSEFIAMECIQPERVGELKKAVDELEALMGRYLGAKTSAKAIVTRDEPELEL